MNITKKVPELPKVPFVRIPKPFRIRKPFNTIHLQKQICVKFQAEQKDKIAKRVISIAKKHERMSKNVSAILLTQALHPESS